MAPGLGAVARRLEGAAKRPRLGAGGRPFQGCGLVDQPDQEGTASSFTLATYNCTSWTSLRKYMGETKVDIILAQETHIKESFAAEPVHWL